jgi:Protein of unknown function (DUF4242)
VPTFMDVHEGMHVTPEQLAEAHKKDLEAQKGSGIEYTRYWLDSKAGHPAHELYEVSEGG